MKLFRNSSQRSISLVSLLAYILSLSISIGVTYKLTKDHWVRVVVDNVETMCYTNRPTVVQDERGHVWFCMRVDPSDKEKEQMGLDKQEKV